MLLLKYSAWNQIHSPPWSIGLLPTDHILCSATPAWAGHRHTQKRRISARSLLNFMLMLQNLDSLWLDVISSFSWGHRMCWFLPQLVKKTTLSVSGRKVPRWKKDKRKEISRSASPLFSNLQETNNTFSTSDWQPLWNTSPNYYSFLYIYIYKSGGKANGPWLSLVTTQFL